MRRAVLRRLIGRGGVWLWGGLDVRFQTQQEIVGREKEMEKKFSNEVQRLQVLAVRAC